MSPRSNRTGVSGGGGGGGGAGNNTQTTGQRAGSVHLVENLWTAPLSAVVGQSYFARFGRLTILLPHFDLRWTLVPRIEAEPPPSLQWWRRLSAVERMLARWSSGRGESNLRTQKKCPRSQISHLSGGKRKDRPELFFPRGFTLPSDGLESRPCPPYGRASPQVLN